MATGDQDLGVTDTLFDAELIGQMTQAAKICPRAPETNVIQGLFEWRARAKATPCQTKKSGSHSPPAVTYHTLLSCLDTDRGLNLVESTWPAGTLVPTHIHHGADEILIVLCGTLQVRIAECTTCYGVGERVFVPRGTPHEVRALSAARTIAILTRTSLEGPSPV